jgi:hypothetical protein
MRNEPQRTAPISQFSGKIQSIHPSLLCCILAVVTLFLYLPVLRYGFVDYDDPMNLTENPLVKNGITLHGLNLTLSTAPFGYYYPLPALSMMVEAQFFGLNPAAFHATNLFLHILNVTLLFFLLIRMTGNISPSFVVAALFAWNPMNVESVAWVSERKGLMNAAFFFGALWFYVNFAKRKSPRSYIACMFFFNLSLLCKPMSVTFPIILLLLDYWPLGRMNTFQADGDNVKTIRPTFSALIEEKIPFFVVALLFGGFALFKEFGAGNLRMDAGRGVLPTLLNGASAYQEYLEKSVFPVGLTAFYPLQVAGVASWSVLVFVLTFGMAVWLVRRQPPVLIGALWFVIMLLPVSNLLAHGDARIADRYAYLSFVGIFLAFAFSLANWHLQRRSQALWALAAPCFVAILCLSHSQVRHWRNSVTLFQHALSVSNDNYVALNNLAWEVLLDDAQPQEARLHAVKMAESACRLTAYTNPNTLDTLYLGYLKECRLPEAERVLDQQIAIAIQRGSAHAKARLVKEKQNLVYQIYGQK